MRTVLRVEYVMEVTYDLDNEEERDDFLEAIRDRRVRDEWLEQFSRDGNVEETCVKIQVMEERSHEDKES